MQIPSSIVRRRLLRKQLGEVTQTFLRFGWKTVLVKVYYPFSNQWIISHRHFSLICHFIFTPGACAFVSGGVVIKRYGSASLFSYSLHDFSVPNGLCGIPLRPKSLRIAYERPRIYSNRPVSIKIQLRCLRMTYEFVTNKLHIF